jgi:hypothetical protein
MLPTATSSTNELAAYVGIRPCRILNPKSPMMLQFVITSQLPEWLGYTNSTIDPTCIIPTTTLGYGLNGF